MEKPAQQTSKIARRARDVQLGEVAGVYPLEVFMRLTGLNRWAVREARRNGLVTIKIGKRRYVRATDFAAYCQRLADSQSAQETLWGK